LRRAFADLNDDGIDELLAAHISDSGTGGWGWHIFQKKQERYAYLGHVFGKIRVEKKSRHGFHDLSVLARLGGTEGETYGPLISFAYDGNRYVEIRRTGVRFMDLGIIDPVTHDWVRQPGWLFPQVEYCENYISGNREWRTLSTWSWMK